MLQLRQAYSEQEDLPKDSIHARVYLAPAKKEGIQTKKENAPLKGSDAE